MVEFPIGKNPRSHAPQVQIVRVDPEFLEGDDVVGRGGRGNPLRNFREAGDAVAGNEPEAPAVEGEDVQGEGGGGGGRGGCRGGHGELGD